MAERDDIISIIKFIADLNKNRDDCSELGKFSEAWNNPSEIITIAERRLNHTMRNLEYIEKKKRHGLKKLLEMSINTIDRFRIKKAKAIGMKNLIRIVLHPT